MRTLQLVGADAFAEHLRALGFDGVQRPGDYYGPSLALGSADVTLWELVDAYRTLANGGAWTPLRLHADAAAGAAAPRRGARSRRPPSSSPTSSPTARAARVTFGLESPLATRFWSGGEDRHQQGHARQLVHRLLAPLHRRRLGRQLLRRADARRQRRHRRGAGLGGGDGLAAPRRRQRAAAAAGAASSARAPTSWTARASGPRRHRAAAGAAARRAPRIVAPTDGTIIAIDPDIPAARQRVALEAVGGAGLRWAVDGRDAGDAATLLLWPPTAGAHEVAVLDAAGRSAASARFTVRGSPPRR